MSAPKSATPWPICALIAQGDDDLAFERIVNKPKRGIGDASVQVLHDSRAQAPRAAPGGGARDRRDRRIAAQGAQGAARTRCESSRAGASSATACRTPSWPKWCWTRPAIPTCGRSRQVGGSAGRLDNLKEFVRSMEEFEILQAFLEHVSLVMEIAQDESGDRIKS